MFNLIFATTNRAKITEITDIIKLCNYEGVSVRDLEKSSVPPDETGHTYSDNAEIKFLYYEKHTMIRNGDLLFAEDSGLEIPCLPDGTLGINSAPFMDRFATKQECFYTIKSMITKTDAELIPACFVCNICARINGKVLHFDGQIDGTISFANMTEDGFGYDPIFIPKGFDQTFAMMPSVQKNTISHRAKAFKKFMKYIVSEHDQH